MRSVSDIDFLRPEIDEYYKEDSYGYLWLIPVFIIDVVMILIGNACKKGYGLFIGMVTGMQIANLAVIIAYICIVNYNFISASRTSIDRKIRNQDAYLSKDGAKKFFAFYDRRIIIGLILCVIGIATIVATLVSLHNFTDSVGERNYEFVSDFTIPTIVVIVEPVGHFIACLGVYLVMCGLRKNEFKKDYCEHCGCLFSVRDGKTLDSRYYETTHEAEYEEREETVGHIELGGGRSIAVTGKKMYYSPEKKYANSYRKYERRCCNCGDIKVESSSSTREI